MQNKAKQLYNHEIKSRKSTIIVYFYLVAIISEKMSLPNINSVSS